MLYICITLSEHRDIKFGVGPRSKSPLPTKVKKQSEPTGLDWFQIGQDQLNRALAKQLNTGVAKNVIFFVGDGLGVSTVTASRFLNKQRNKLGTMEEAQLSFENFPHVALAMV